jgi:ABC-type dipeptide/oligopeptide/nickel transport system ATPase component
LTTTTSSCPASSRYPPSLDPLITSTSSCPASSRCPHRVKRCQKMSPSLFLKLGRGVMCG